MTLPLPGNPIDDSNIQKKFDAIAMAWQDNKAQTATLNAAGQVDVAIQSTDRFVVIEYSVELSAFNAELRLHPNALTTAIYLDIRDGSYETGAPAAAAVAAQGNGVAHVNGLRLSFQPQGTVAGGTLLSGRAIFYTAVPTVAGAVRRTCMAQTAVTSTTGSGNHAVELQNIASVMGSAVALTSLRFLVSAGAMTGAIRVTRG
jgi:hypothetical protein